MDYDQKSQLYTIIIGATKSGSTSLFYYLAEHPQICASSVKEPRFFLDEEYPLYSRYRLGRDGLDQYKKLFETCADKNIYLEASPQYLFSQGTAVKIKENLKNVKLIVILRDPIERLISYYQFGKQNGVFPEGYSIKEYIKTQHANLASHVEGREELRALDHGRYGHYLKSFLNVFDKDQLHFIHFESFKQDPKSVMKSLSHFIGIDSSFYHTFDFKIYNETKQTKNIFIHQTYNKLRVSVSNFLFSKNQFFWKSFRKGHKLFSPIIKLLNSKPKEKVEVDEEIKGMLIDFYLNDHQLISKLIGCGDFDWDKPFNFSTERVEL